MFNIQVNKDAYKQESVSNSSSNVITKSGFYDITLDSVALRKTSTNNPYIHIRYRKGIDNKEGNVGHFFLWLVNKDGTESFDKKTFMDLMVVLGIDKLDKTEPREIQYKEGTKTLDCYKEFDNKVVHLYARQTFYLNGKKEVQEKFDRLTFFDKDKKTAFEIINGSEPKRYEKLSSNPDSLKANYSNGCTIEQAEAYKASFSSNKEAGGGVNPNTPKPSFLSSLDGENDELPF